MSQYDCEHMMIHNASYYNANVNDDDIDVTDVCVLNRLNF